MTGVILFPSSFLNPREVDEDLAEEYRAARLAGGFETIVFDYQAWFREQRLRLSHVPEREITAVYRGWMMKPEQYAVFYRELLSQKIRLLTTPEMYEKLHLFPRVYPALLPNTARMLTFTEGIFAKRHYRVITWVFKASPVVLREEFLTGIR